MDSAHSCVLLYACMATLTLAHAERFPMPARFGTAAADGRRLTQQGSLAILRLTMLPACNQRR
jgi:hypothetical protein